MLLQKLKIDDPVDASPVHGFCGVWGVVATWTWEMLLVFFPAWALPKYFSHGFFFLGHSTGAMGFPFASWMVL